jgi:hypothetical protein
VAKQAQENFKNGKNTEEKKDDMLKQATRSECDKKRRNLVRGSVTINPEVIRGKANMVSVYVKCLWSIQCDGHDSVKCCVVIKYRQSNDRYCCCFSLLYAQV